MVPRLQSSTWAALGSQRITILNPVCSSGPFELMTLAGSA